MPISLTIKNIPDDLAQALRNQAKRHHRSIQGELMSILECHVVALPFETSPFAEASVPVPPDSSGSGVGNSGDPVPVSGAGAEDIDELVRRMRQRRWGGTE